MLHPRLRQFCFLASLFWAAAGLSVGYVTGEWDIFPTLALVVAGLLLFLWLITQPNLVGLWGQRSTQTSTNAIATTVAVIAILGILNFVGVRYSTTLDVTETQQFTLAPQSQSLLENLEEPVRVLIFDQAIAPADRDLLQRYQNQSDKFKFELVNPREQFGLAQEFQVSTIGEVYLEQGDRKTLVTTLGQDQGGLTESTLTNALQQFLVTTQEPIYFVQGHGERPLEVGEGGMFDAVSALSDRNFEARPLILAQEKAVPDDALAVAVVGPQRSFLPGEVQLLENYLDGGGRLLLFLDPTIETGFDSLLDNWGVALDGRIVIDASIASQLVGLQPDMPVATQYGNHPITSTFQEGISFYPSVQAVTTTEQTGITVANLVETSDQSWSETNPTEDPLQFNPEVDARGPLALGVVATKEVTGEVNAAESEAGEDSAGEPPEEAEGNEPENADNTGANEMKEGRLVVFGTSTFIADGLFTQQLNGDVFLNSVSWLSDRDESSLALRPRESNDRQLLITEFESNILRLLALAILPLGALGTAGWLWWRSR
ncbi:MAG: Gldg family protein [Cyanobacteria bacterium P01_C01_bin.89]